MGLWPDREDCTSALVTGGFCYEYSPLDKALSLGYFSNCEIVKQSSELETFEKSEKSEKRGIMKRKLILLSLLVLCSLVSAQTACATRGIDYQNTGQSPYVGPHEGVRLLWYKPWTGHGRITMDSQGYMYHNLSSQSGKFNSDGDLIAVYDHPSQFYYSWWPVISPNEYYVIIKNVVIEIDFQDGFLIERGVISNAAHYWGTITDDGHPLLLG